MYFFKSLTGRFTMQILSNELLRELLNIKELPIVYHIDSSIYLKQYESFENFDPSVIQNRISENINGRPFDEMIIVAPYKWPESYEGDNFLCISLLTKKSKYFGNYVYNVNTKKITEIYGGAATLKICDEGVFNLDKFGHIMVFSLDALVHKNTNIFIFGEGRALKKSKKKKFKKQKFLYVTDKKYITDKKYEKDNIKVFDYEYAFKVCGHWRIYENKDTKGHDFNGAPVKGKTWIRPYTKGEGLELYNKIRIFTK